MRRSSAAARVTCGLCRGLVRDATTVPECLHSFCRSCIYEKFADEEDSCCPTCNIDLGCSPLDKIRADHHLQSVREKLFPSKRQKNEGVPSLHPAAITEEEEGSDFFDRSFGFFGPASVVEFNPVRFKIKTKKSIRSSGVPVVSDQNIPKDQATKEVLVQNTSQAKVHKDKVVEKAPEQASVPALVQDPVVILTPSVEVDVPEGFQRVPTPVSNSSQSNKFPFYPRFIEDKELDEIWRKVLDRQAEIGYNTFFAEYNDMAIRHMVENYAVVGGLTQRIKNLEQKHSELKNLEKIKEEVVAKEARITKLEEECQAKDRSIAYTITKHKEVIETFKKKIAEQTQAVKRAEKALEFEQDKGAVLMQSLDEKIMALNKMIFDMGSGSSLPTLRDPTEKMNYFGQLLEDLKGLLKTTRENYVQTMKEAVARGVSFALAKLKASDLSINLQAIEEDFNCLPDDAIKFLEEVRPLGDKVADEMEVGSPSSSN